MTGWAFQNDGQNQWYTRGQNFCPKTKVFTIRPSVFAAECQGWIWPKVKFLNGLLNSRKYCQCKLSIVTEQISSNVKFFFDLNTKVISKINLNKLPKLYKKLHTYLLKTLETLNCSKIPPNFTYICTFGFGFGIQPKARCFSGQIFGLKWKTYFRSFTAVCPSVEFIHAKV